MTQRRAPLLSLAVTIYAIPVVTAAVVGAVTIRSAEDASIGGVLLLGLVCGLGLPWSLAVFVADNGFGGSISSALIYSALAVVNCFLVVLVKKRALSRSGANQ
jgi:hypothetical protein